MGYSSFLRSPKKEEQEVPDSTDTQFVDADKDDRDINIMDELEGLWGVNNEDEEQKLATDHSSHSQLTWDFMDWEGLPNGEEEDDEEDRDHQLQIEFKRNFHADQETDLYEEKINVKKEINLGFWDEDENRVSLNLNLNLNYQEVLDAWSDRGPLWANDFPSSMASHGCYMGEVPVMMEEDRRRRKASVLRYKEKRRSRLFSKKIRYQVRKLNADKRPRFKGRFVKRI